MFSWIKLITVLLIAASVFLWPLAAIFAFLLLESPANKWNFVAYLLLLSLLAHFPLTEIARKQIKYAGSFAQMPEKIRIVAPAIANIVLLTGLVVYLGLACNWKFSCGS